MSPWELGGGYAGQRREIKRGNVGGRRMERARGGQVQGQRGRGQKGGEENRETDSKKKLIPTHGLWLCASESTCSLSKGQSWSCLPETGGKGWARGTALWQVWGWEPKHTVEGDGSECVRVGGAQCGGWCCLGVGLGC